MWVILEERPYWKPFQKTLCSLFLGFLWPVAVLGMSVEWFFTGKVDWS